MSDADSGPRTVKKVPRRRVAIHLSPSDQARVDSGEIQDPFQAVREPEPGRREWEVERSDSNDQRLKEDVPPHW